MLGNSKLDLANLWIPTYQIAQSRVPVALIKVGKQGYIRKLPPKSRYFYDKDLGLFEIKPDRAIIINKSEFYIYDIRNQNAIDVGALQRLLTWADNQGIYKIRRADVEHAIRLRTRDIKQLEDEAAASKKAIRAFILKVKAEIKEINAKTIQRKEAEVGLEDNPDEYHIIDQDEENLNIIDNLFKNGYIDAKQLTILKTRLTKGEIESQEQLLSEIDSFSVVMVTEPIPMDLERFLDEFHTYDPASIVGIVTRLGKIYKGFKNLRTKPVINWFPWTYILGGCLGAGIVIMMVMNYLPQDLSGILPTQP